MTDFSSIRGKVAPVRRLGRRLGGLAYDLTPQVFAVLTFGAGALMLTSALTPAFAERLRLLGEAVPPLLIDLSHFAASVTGFVLLVLAAGLWRRRRGAYWAALAVLAGGAVFSLLKGLDWEEAIELTVVAALLAPCRAAFTRRSRLLEPLRPGWLLVLLAAVAALLWLGFFAYRDVAYTDDLWWSLVTDEQASGFLRAAGGLSVLTLLAAGWSLMTAPGARSHGPAGPADLVRARAALETAQTASPGAGLALLGDKALMFSPSGRSFIAYRVRGRRWIAMGEPVGLKAERRELLWTFAETADSYGAAAVFYAVGEGLLGDLATMGLAVRKVGESAVIDPAAFTLSGRSRQNLRTAVSRAEREGATFEVLPPGSAAANIEALRAISDQWLRTHQGVEKAFSMGWFDPDHLDRGPLAVARLQGRIVAFANLLVAGDELEVDLMRHRPDAPPGVMDYLFVRSIEWARDQGFRAFGLGGAPLSGLENRRMAPVFARVGALVFDEAGGLYGFSGLRAYKAKFSPDWRPTFIAAPASTPLALALLDVALLTSGGWRGLLGMRRSRSS